MTAIAIGAVGETSVRNLCLGFVIQKEDTVQGIERRLKRRFSSERFPRGSASKRLPGLASQGLVELVEKGARPALARYRATAKGVAYFHEWLRETELPPAVRDALQCKLEFFDIQEIPDVIETVKEYEEEFAAATAIAHEQLQKERRVRNARRRRGTPPDWRLEINIIKTKDAAKMGGVMGDRLEQLREDLEELDAAYQEATTEAG